MKSIILIFIIFFIKPNESWQRLAIGIPNDLTISFTNSGALLQWQFANYNNDRDFRFRIRYRKIFDTVWQQIETRETRFLLNPLDRGQQYEVEVLALGADGQTTASPRLQFLFPTQDSVNVPTPQNLRVAVLSATSVNLAWDPIVIPSQYVDQSIYYSIRISKQSHSPTVDDHKYVRSTSIVLQGLESGSEYLLEVRARLSQKESDPNSVRVSMPTTTENVYRATNLQISTRTDDPSTVTLTWKILDEARPKISGYTVWYSTDRDAQNRNSRQISGSEPQVVLDGLTAATDYFVKVETHFTDGSSPTESAQYKFTTQTEQPIKNVHIMYMPDGKIRLEWTLFDFADTSRIEGFKVLWSTRREFPESQWNSSFASGNERSVTLTNPTSNSQYFVKILLQIRGKGLQENPSVFRFQTREVVHTHTVSVNQPSANQNPLVYRQSGPTSVLLRWEFPETSEINGYEIMYTTDRNIPVDQWQRMFASAGTNEATLTGLTANQEYFVQVRPRTSGGYLDGSGVYRIFNSGGSNPSSENSVIPETTGRPVRRQDQSQTATNEQDRFCLLSCRISDSGTNEGCRIGEICVRHCDEGRTGPCSSGWCMPSSFLNSAKQTSN